MTTGDVLLALVEADEVHRPNRTAFYVSRAMGPAGVGVIHPGLAEGFRCAEQDLLDLVDACQLRAIPGARSWSFDVTEAGFDYSARLKLAAAAGTNQAEANRVLSNPLDWDARVLPVLQAVGRASSHAQPNIGVSIEMVTAELGEVDASDTAMILDDLCRASYLEQTIDSDQLPGPAWCRLAEKGLQVTAGWPTSSGEAAFDRLLTLIEEGLAAATTSEERTKWERLRDGVAGVGRDVLVGVLTTTANATAKGIAS